jgi:hypothetical protein
MQLLKQPQASWRGRLASRSGRSVHATTPARAAVPAAAARRCFGAPAAAAAAVPRARRRAAVVAASSIDLDALGLDIPDLGDEVRGHQETLGATFNVRISDDGVQCSAVSGAVWPRGSKQPHTTARACTCTHMHTTTFSNPPKQDDDVAASFNNTGKVVDALGSGVALIDRSHWGRVRIGGADRLSFLHNQSTNDFKALRPGQGCDTVFVTATARCLDLATALVMENQVTIVPMASWLPGSNLYMPPAPPQPTQPLHPNPVLPKVMLLVSPSMRDALLQRFDKFIFPADKVEAEDVSGRCRMFTLAGPKARTVLADLGGVSRGLGGWARSRLVGTCTHRGPDWLAGGRFIPPSSANRNAPKRPTTATRTP